MEGSPLGNFGRHRKIMPFEPGSVDALRAAARAKAAALNQHVLGYGETAEPVNNPRRFSSQQGARTGRFETWLIAARFSTIIRMSP